MVRRLHGGPSTFSVRGWARCGLLHFVMQVMADLLAGRTPRPASAQRAQAVVRHAGHRPTTGGRPAVFRKRFMAHPASASISTCHGAGSPARGAGYARGMLPAWRCPAASQRHGIKGRRPAVPAPARPDGPALWPPQVNRSNATRNRLLKKAGLDAVSRT